MSTGRSEVESATTGDPAVAAVRVLHLVKGLNAGGTESLLVLAARHRDRSRFTYEVAYLLADHVALRDAIEEQGVRTTCLVRSVWWDPTWLGRLRRRLRTHPVDIIHAHSPLMASAARLVRLTLPAATRPRLVVTVHNVWPSHHPAVRLIDRATHRLDDARLAVSDAVRRSLPGRAAERATTHLHGIDVEALRERADRQTAREELEVGDDELLIGTVANPSPAKGYPDLIAAAAIVAAVRPQVTFIGIGTGPQLAQLRADPVVEELGDRFRMVGHRPDAARLVAGFDIFCLPSHHEGLPLALMEALVLGIPVVVTDVGGMSELVTPGQEGELVPTSRPDVLASALLALVDDPARRAVLSKAAWQRGSSLDAATAIGRVEDVYDRVLGRG